MWKEGEENLKENCEVLVSSYFTEPKDSLDPLRVFKQRIEIVEFPNTPILNQSIPGSLSAPKALFLAEFGSCLLQYCCAL